MVVTDSLYNPSYGYFSKEATIFNPGEPFEFNRMKDETEFQRLLARRYTTFEDKLDAVERNPTRQLWHTPTELFRPYYGEAIARYLVENYKLTHHPYHDLTIYEMGAGNGTLMLNILDHIRDLYPEVYEHTQFKVIEISSHLASLQNQQLAQTASSRGHAEHVQIINRSVFGWDTPVPEPCWFLALEVFDNFAHDCIRYHPGTEQPQQASVLIDNDGEFYEFYTSALDPIAERYVRVRNAACGGALPPNHPLRWPPPPLRRLRAQLPFAPAFTPPEYIPTRLLQFFEKLNEFFPLHRLLTSDFHKLPESVPGYNAPVVQTRYKRQTVPVTTPLVSFIPHLLYSRLLYAVKDAEIVNRPPRTTKASSTSCSQQTLRPLRTSIGSSRASSPASYHTRSSCVAGRMSRTRAPRMGIIPCSAGIRMRA